MAVSSFCTPTENVTGANWPAPAAPGVAVDLTVLERVAVALGPAPEVAVALGLVTDVGVVRLDDPPLQARAGISHARSKKKYNGRFFILLLLCELERIRLD